MEEVAMASSAPYTINIPEDRLEKLGKKLALAEFPNELNGSDWDYGVPLAEVKRLTAYWQNGYDWRTHEKRLNTFSNYSIDMDIEGFESLNVHFLHETSAKSSSIPLLFVHGWPGSYIEVLKLLPLLTSPSDGGPSFHVIAPSLPNFAWSDGPQRRGFGLAQYAEVCHRIMQHLGYKQYVTQGGDWGFYITRTISLLYPKHCLATHLNLVRCCRPSFTSHPIAALQHAVTPYSEAEKAGLERSNWFVKEGSGYKSIQATKPQTPGYAVSDSPVGLLAWILEKLHDWTDSYPWTDDEILTWVSIYYFSRAGPAASFRIYYEATHAQPSLTPKGREEKEGGFVSRDRTEQYIGNGVMLGLAYFPREITNLPRTWGHTLGHVIHVGEHKQGGHFAAHENPRAIADDLSKMFGKGGPCDGIVPGRKGY